MSSNYVSFDGNRLREARRKKGLTQLDLAEEIGATQEEISDYEREVRGCYLKRAWKIIDILGETYDNVIRGSIPEDVEKDSFPKKKKARKAKDVFESPKIIKEQRRLAAVMFTDIVGYTAIMSKDERKALQILQKNRDILKPLIKQLNGEWLKEMADGTISIFHSTLDAVNCAVEIQSSLKDETDFKLRIGIHIGDVVFSEGDIFGDGVNIASRIQPLAEPGGICVSYRVYDDILNKPELEAVFVGEKKLKNVIRPIKVYAITSAGLPAPLTELSTDKKIEVKLPIAAPEKKKPILSSKLIFSCAAAVVLFVILLYGWILPTYFNKDTTKGKIDSLAILPFISSSEHDDVIYLSEGIPESIISSMQKLPDIKVISFSLVQQRYKDEIPSPSVIGSDLNVKSVVVGRMSLRGEELTINIEIVDTRDNSVILAKQYFEKLADPCGYSNEDSRGYYR